ncbi:DUF3040 domain-containing protein [Streptomyces mutabilis]|uniref:DUF3040 domain-containing protein n=1 Tax=Streptomyces mutabilis TaxID=67332 RepID=UPI000BD509FB|nr:DUF3040 domain-containing protein [Streptomyces sp. alain-838]PAK25583.1 hypothetical protein CJD44_15460 [Streptomyces sp. alain-838]
MPGPDDQRLSEIEYHLHREDPRFADALDAGRPRRPREYRPGRAWLLLATALAVLGAGLFLAHGLLIAAGLVMAGIAAELLDPHRRGRPDRHPPPRSWPRSWPR